MTKMSRISNVYSFITAKFKSFINKPFLFTNNVSTKKEISMSVLPTRSVYL